MKKEWTRIPYKETYIDLFRGDCIYINGIEYFCRANLNFNRNYKILSIETPNKSISNDPYRYEGYTKQGFVVVTLGFFSKIETQSKLIEALILGQGKVGGDIIECDAIVHIDRSKNTIVLESFHGNSTWVDPETGEEGTKLTIPYSDGVKLLHFYCQCYLAFVDDFASEKKEDPEFPMLLEQIKKLNVLYDEMVKKGEIMEEE